MPIRTPGKSSKAKRVRYAPIPRPITRKAALVALGDQALPNRISNMHRYVERVTMSLTSGAGSFRFTANGLNDPSITGTGHQPFYFDQLGALYNFYYVKKSNIKVTLFGPHQEAAAQPTLVISLVTDNSSSGNFNTEAEKPSSSRILCTDLGTGQGMYPSVWNTFDAKKRYGAQIVNNPEFRGTSASNPNEQTYFNIQASDFALTGLTELDLLVEINYYTEWNDRKLVNGS